MKSIAQLITSAVAAGALLGSVASHATDISELPLKASVLAKPNVIFALDNSGSMDAEVLLSGPKNAVAYFMRNSTVFYPSTALRTGGDVRFDILFPTGTGPGNRVDVDNSWGPRALPATPQFGWARSVDYNPIYYNSLKTYEPWAPSWVSGVSATVYTDSNPASAKTHPLLGSTTVALNADLFNTGTTWRFTYTAGMVIPLGSSTFTCENGSEGPLPYTVTVANKACIAASPYYPATFWKKEACTIDGVSCVAAWDTNTIKRYEIKPATASYPSGRSYTDEMKNFANWFTYYRKRRLFMGAAMGDVLEYMTGLNLGVVTFNSRAAPTMFDLDSSTASNNRLAATTKFYVAENSGSTPTHATMAYIADQFDTNTSIIKYACQRNAMFVLTDGFANDSFTTPPGYSTATYGSGAPYTTIATGSLHDKALGYYTRRLRATTSPLTAGLVPVPTGTSPKLDKNPDLHINTYGMTLGIPGTIYPTAVDPYVTAPTWPTPVSDTATMIDDLWHATINGRGLMYSANDVAGTVTSVQDGLAAILSQSSAQSGVAVSTVNLVRGDSRAYFGNYNPSGWIGDVVARSINPATGVVDGSTTVWSASTLLSARSWGTRVIASFNGTTGVGFTAAGVGALVNPASVYGTTAQVMDYLRGDRSNEGTLFRKRTSLMGPVINSEPYISNDDGVLYVASGEGMLHAFDIKTSGSPGKELWAFVPRQALVDIGATVARGYSFKTQLDGSPVVGTIGSGKKILVAGMGAAAGGFYAIDVTSPRAYDETTLASKVMWEFPASGDTAMQAKVGQSLGRPVITKTMDDGHVVLVTSGYNSTADGKGRLWMLNANSGAVIKEFVVADGDLVSEAGLAHVAAFDEGDGTARYVFGGDLLGNVWRFDMKAKTSPDKVAALTGPTGVAQAVTTTPELAKIDGNRVIVMPTGRLLGVTDAGNNKVQSIYVIKDGSTLSPARSSLVAQTYTRGSPDTLTSNPVDWSTQRGWYMDLPAGEHGNTRPSITFGGVAFVTNVNGGTDCSASSYLYLLDVKNGNKFPDATFIGAQISDKAGAASVTTVVTSDGKARGLVQDYNGLPQPPKTWNPPTIPPSKSSWREVRRQ